MRKAWWKQSRKCGTLGVEDLGRLLPRGVQPKTSCVQEGRGKGEDGGGTKPAHGDLINIFFEVEGLTASPPPLDDVGPFRKPASVTQHIASYSTDQSRQ